MLEKKTVSQCISADYCRGWNDAVDAITRWISVKERLPEYGRCLVAVKLTNRKTIKTATYNEHGWWIDLPAFDSEITHWMPLPEPPKEE